VNQDAYINRPAKNLHLGYQNLSIEGESGFTFQEYRTITGKYSRKVAIRMNDLTPGLLKIHI
jgi:hypothetical protein